MLVVSTSMQNYLSEISKPRKYCEHERPTNEKKNVACMLLYLHAYTLWVTEYERIYIFFYTKKILVNILELELLCMIRSFFCFSASHWWALWLLVCTHYRWQCIVVYICWKYEFFCCCSLFYFVALHGVLLVLFLLTWRDTLFSGCALLGCLLVRGPSANTQSKHTIVIIHIEEYMPL